MSVDTITPADDIDPPMDSSTAIDPNPASAPAPSSKNDINKPGQSADASSTSKEDDNHTIATTKEEDDVPDDDSDDLSIVITPRSSRELKCKFKEYADESRRNRRTPKRSISVLSKSDACAWKQIFPTVLSQILEMLGLVDSTYNWQHLAATIFFASTALFLLVVAFARSYLLVFFLAVFLLVLLPSVALSCAAAWMSKQFIKNRKEALPTAKLTLLQRMQARRVDHQKRFDVHLPPPLEDSDDSGPQQVPGLIFLPGALVEHRAYANLAALLSDQGIVVAVVSLEPIRFATKHAGAGPDDVYWPVVDYMARHHKDKVAVKDWAIGGHSMGGTAAFNLVEDVNPKKLVLLASGTAGEKTASLKQSSVQILSISASKDALVNAWPSMVKKFKDKMVPPGTKFEVIKGGNHAGFGHYGTQTFPMPDGKRTIPRSEQQMQAVELAASFLLDRDVRIDRQCDDEADGYSSDHTERTYDSRRYDNKPASENSIGSKKKME